LLSEFATLCDVTPGALLHAGVPAAFALCSSLHQHPHLHASALLTPQRLSLALLPFIVDPRNRVEAAALRGQALSGGSSHAPRAPFILLIALGSAERLTPAM
jgi:hypothetical protein